VLPSNVRGQVGLSYLFARAVDTIADTDLIDRSRRLFYLQQFRHQFSEDAIHWDEVRSIQTSLLPHQTHSSERVLLTRLEDCFRLYQEYTVEDRQRIRTLMSTLPNGMEMDLTKFPGESAATLTALQTTDDMDRYIYYVAGCVGEFWTGMMCAHMPSLSHWDIAHMSAIGIRFGKGLQLTNILKDLPRDLRRGRCYIPEVILKEAGLTPADLLQKENVIRYCPVLSRLLKIAVDHLDQGWAYTMQIPRRETRLRLSCMWPILLAGETLKRVAISPDILDPAVNIKVPRYRVYQVMALTILTGACGYIGTAYWGHLRKQII
jgi:farnesyl-diphosphate farnesyltransferase